MFTKKTDINQVGLKMCIDRLFAKMDDVDPTSEEYAAMVDQMDTLYKLREVDVKVNASQRVSADTWAIVAANLLGIGMIVGHERASVVTSKALSYVMKLAR